MSKEFWHGTFSGLYGHILAVSPVAVVSRIGTRQLTDHFDSFGKAYAMVETNDTAEHLEMPKTKVTLRGTPQKQAAYTRTLLALADRKRFQFVVLFIHQDYDQLWDTIQATAPELFMAWRDCGLLDKRGQACPAEKG